MNLNYIIVRTENLRTSSAFSKPIISSSGTMCEVQLILSKLQFLESIIVLLSYNDSVPTCS